MSGVDIQMFNNWQGKCIDQSEWTQAAGLKQSPLFQELTL